MATSLGFLTRRRLRRRSYLPSASLIRSKTTSTQHVSSRHTDPTFEKLMDGYKHLLKVSAVIDLIIASPSLSLPLPLLSSAAQRLRLNRGAPHFLRSFPHIFSLHQSTVQLTPTAAQITHQESSAASASSPASAETLVRLLSISPSRSLPLRAVFKVWRDLGLPDDFEDSILARNPNLFSLTHNPNEPNTHLLTLADKNPNPSPNFTPAVNRWRERECSGAETGFAFKQSFPPGMRLTKNFRSKVKEWQGLPYTGPYDPVVGGGNEGMRSKAKMRAAEKRAVGIAHEFLSLTAERMVEVERISHFRKWFGIELNIRDLFLDHPGIFYLSTKGKGHTVFLREAYERGRLINPNPVYDARRRLLELVLMRKRGVVGPDKAGDGGE